MKSFLQEVNEKINGVPVQRCYHCRKCTAGCPMTQAMEHNPNRVIKMIQMGRREAVLNSATIWLCVSCETCITRCPNEVDIARMMDVLRQMAIETGVGAKEKNILKFHEAFLANIRRGGRINEPSLMVEYKLKSGDLFSDMAMGLDMFMKGKLSLISPRTKDMESVRRIFEKTRQS
ncbi:MAG: 4Fe-4S dicluster domain-containing protein [Proteobacteria bacterium]|nr:4Fe-4S dicluster domain-containing protein [Pseudomonadota bacterium]MBU4580829.1 4Fe-4S dicluster domain-containing protein [Pseudomonadota bacterium]MCG2739238.1 4Fe-4S dicluster domain-containing protein [Syntrophaceae bacterium]